jgi:two-component system, NtrC family, response regulator AtoC
MPKPKNIFLVEDSEIFSVLMNQRLCEMPELKVYAYTSAEEAIKDLYIAPDVIVLDNFLPGMTGIEALKRIKQKKPDIPVVLISSQENPQLSIQAFNAGASDFISKSAFSADAICKSIIKALSESDALFLKSYKSRKVKIGILASLAILIIIGIIYYNLIT